MPEALTFAAVDDLVAAHARSRLAAPVRGQGFAPTQLGPIVELAWVGDGTLLGTDWLEDGMLHDLRTALLKGERGWSSTDRQTGFLRTVFDPLSDDDDKLVRTAFFLSAQRAAKAAGFTNAAASFAAALRELESNVHEHSEHADTGLLAFRADKRAFEFVVADKGVGVLATLSQAPEYRALRDHGEALDLALREGVSRYGAASNRGMGFRDLFEGLSMLNADLRFRSGDHALTISGERPELKQRQLAQKPFYRGFLVSARCELSARA